MLGYYYLVFFLRRVFRVSRRGAEDEDIREWKVRLVLLCAHSLLALSVLAMLFPNAIDHGPTALWALAIVTPLLALNEYVLSRKQSWLQYRSRFVAWSAPRRGLADLIATAFFIVSLMAPLVARAYKAGRLWWF